MASAARLSAIPQRRCFMVFEQDGTTAPGREKSQERDTTDRFSTGAVEGLLSWAHVALHMPTLCASGGRPGGSRDLNLWAGKNDQKHQAKTARNSVSRAVLKSNHKQGKAVKNGIISQQNPDPINESNHQGTTSHWSDK